jgi:hypothetical protein
LIGVVETVALARERFSGIVKDYLAVWADQTRGDSTEFAEWLEQLRQSVGQEVGGLWGNSEWHVSWFERVCQPKVDDALGELASKERLHARCLEIKHLDNPQMSLTTIVEAGAIIDSAMMFDRNVITLRLGREAATRLGDEWKHLEQCLERSKSQEIEGLPPKTADSQASPVQDPSPGDQQLLQTAAAEPKTPGPEIGAVSRADLKPPQITTTIASWEDIEILFLSDHRVQIRDGAKQETYNYEELGFADGRVKRGKTPKPNRAWAILRETAIQAGAERLDFSMFAVAVAFGERALGRFRVPIAGRVTYLALEEPAERTHRRLKDIVPTADARLQNINFIYQIPALMTGGAAQLDAFLTANPSELVVVDTLLALVAAHTGRKDVLRGDYLEVNTLRQITDKHKAAMLCVAHSRKAAGDAVDSIIGTSGTTAACDAVWQLQTMSTGEASLTVKGREYEEALYGLKFNSSEPFGWQVTSAGAEVGMSEERRDILLLLQQEGAKKPADIARLLGNKNINTVRRLIQKLAYDGLIRLQSNGTYVPNVNAMNDVNDVTA